MRNGHAARLLTLGIMLTLIGCNKTGTSSDSSNSGSATTSTAAQNASGTTASSSSTPAGSLQSGTGQGGPAQGGAASTSASASAPAAPILIGAGRILTVTVDQDISTKTSKQGDHFEASLDAPISVDGNEVLPKGTHVRGVITQSAPAGRIKGGAVLSLKLDAIHFQGRTYKIATAAHSEEGKARGKRTIVGGGGGAALGAIVGGIAGGGKGAAIGGAAGAGAGTAGAAYTGDRDLTIPAETKLQFKLTKAVSIRQ